jgi:hypothetical protein
MAKKSNMPDPGHFLVAEKRCAECLFTPNRVVSAERAAEIVEKCEREGSYFVCHKGSLTGNDQLCCRGFYDAHETRVTRLAKVLDLVKFVPIPKVN